MIGESKLKSLLNLITDSSGEELEWMHNYLSGVVLNGKKQPQIQTYSNTATKITIAYGTETGNSKRLATTLLTKAKQQGVHAKLVSLDQYRLNDLVKENYFLTIISTQGEGEPPAAAKKFYDHIHHNGFSLDKLKYGVLALGDTSYPLFCKTGEEVDIQLQNLGGKRIIPLQKCDLDFEEDANEWFDKVLHSLKTIKDPVPSFVLSEQKKTTRKKIYVGKVLINTNLNDLGSNKETRHIELAVDNLEYEPGDSIGIVPENTDISVAAILSILGINQDRQIQYKEELCSASYLLKKRLSILYLTEGVIKKYASIAGMEVPVFKTDLLELLKTYPLKDNSRFDEIFQILNPISPRLYTVASSPKAHSGEVHLTVVKDKYSVKDEARNGLCSQYLAGLAEDNELCFFVQKNKRFSLAAPDKDIIMIGPGTGIAPFRSFLAERDLAGASGKSWLIFGEQHFRTDFLYQTEIQNWKATGTLTNIDLAFSRDQPEKIYVQHKIWKRGAEFYEWINAGAYIYLCGTKTPMSGDVELMLISIIEKFGKKTNTEANEYLDQMSKEGRYMKDVY